MAFADREDVTLLYAERDGTIITVSFVYSGCAAYAYAA
jgi:hypothetical protein